MPAPQPAAAPDGGAVARTRPPVPSATRQSGSRRGFYVWGGVVLAVVAVAIIFGWHATGGTPDPTDTAIAMGPGAAVLNSAVLVFREGLECILVLAAVTASMRGANGSYRRPVAVGGAVGLLASVGTWFLIVAFIGLFDGRSLAIQAATGIPAIVVLLIVMNWFFHKLYWTGWISLHNKRRKGVVGSAKEVSARRTLLGLALLGFTSVYREGFEVVVFLQALRERFGDAIVAKGTSLGLLFTLAIGVLTFALHARLPYKKMLVITGGLLVVVLFVMVGEQVNEMQLAGWIPTTPIAGITLPDWAGTWFSLFANVQTVVGQVVALAIVIGSYVAAQYIQVWRPRRRGARPATIATAPPVAASDRVLAGSTSQAA